MRRKAIPIGNCLSPLLATISLVTPCRVASAQPGPEASPVDPCASLPVIDAKEIAPYVDCFPQLVNWDGGFPAAPAHEGLHLNRHGYGTMRPFTNRAIAQANR